MPGKRPINAEWRRRMSAEGRAGAGRRAGDRTAQTAEGKVAPPAVKTKRKRKPIPTALKAIAGLVSWRSSSS